MYVERKEPYQFVDLCTSYPAQGRRLVSTCLKDLAGLFLPSTYKGKLRATEINENF